MRTRIAQLEMQRAGGVVALEDMIAKGEHRALAIRALGRIGGEDALKQLVALIPTEPAAVPAIEVAAALDEPTAEQRALLGAALAKAPDPAAAALAIGRAGGLEQVPWLFELVANGSDDAKAAAGIALGRLGRRKLAWTDEHGALVTALASPNARVRYGAAFALARQQLAKDAAPNPEVTAALETVATGDADPENRALAVLALAHTHAAQATALGHALVDHDWRVEVEAVRAIGADDADPKLKDLLAAATVRAFDELLAGNAAEAQVVVEALHQLQSSAKREPVAAALAGLHDKAHDAVQLPPITRGWILCLSQSAIERAAPSPSFAAIASCELNDHLRLPLVADAISAGAGTPAARRAALAPLLVHRDPRVRAAGLGALASQWKDGDERDHAATISAVAAALASKDPIVAGAAADALPDLYEAIGTGDHAELDAALVARATSETDPELSASLLELIGKRVLVAGAGACRAGVAGVPVRASAAAECLAKLGEHAPATPPQIPPSPPVDLAAAVGHHTRWHIATTRGEIVIELDAERAPVAVATLITLTQRGFYDNKEFHRVVPDFVVQGGDPTESGWGGPGFTLPAEPTADPGFVTGGVGLADAGRDSAGSQWFIMHSPAPHLDGRYTYVGKVVVGQAIADSLLVGDKVVRASLETVP
ncbi:MAG TPA: peptidylprolyl isomerase [Kofleriaceae bacterium]